MTKRKNLFALAGAFILLACPIAAPVAQAENQTETEVSWEDLPKAVQDALADTNPVKEFESLTRQEENGFVTYEAEYETENGDAEIELAEAGDIIEVESEVDAKALPATIVERIEQQFPGAKIDEVSMVRETSYEIELMEGSQEIELSFYADGSEFENDQGDLGNRGGFDEFVDWEDAPKAVLDSLAAYLLSVEFESMERDEKNGLVSYKAVYLSESGDGQIKLTEAGDILENRKNIQPQSLPVAIANQIKQRFPDATLADATEFQATYYEVALEKDSGEIEVAYAADGTVVDDE